MMPSGGLASHLGHVAQDSGKRTALDAAMESGRRSDFGVLGVGGAFWGLIPCAEMNMF